MFTQFPEVIIKCVWHVLVKIPEIQNRTTFFKQKLSLHCSDKLRRCWELVDFRKKKRAEIRNTEDQHLIRACNIKKEEIDCLNSVSDIE